MARLKSYPASCIGILLGRWPTALEAKAAAEGARVAVTALLEQQAALLRPMPGKPLENDLEAGITRHKTGYRVKLQGLNKILPTLDAARTLKTKHIEWLAMTPSERFESAVLIINKND